jgi:hypothetical protein
MIRKDAGKPSPVPPPPASEQDRAEFGTAGLIRLGLWGGTAAICLLAVALATKTEAGKSRIAAAYAPAGAAEPALRLPAARQAEIETRRLTETIRSLAEDRDRLLARMTALERNYEDVTGSIGRLANAARAPSAPAAPAAPPPAIEPPAPVASAPAGTPVPAAAPHAAPVAAGTAEPAAEPVPIKAEFGVDIGGGPTLASLRSAWERIRRNHAALLEGLRPVIAIRDGRGGQVELRLVVGPIGNAAAAARLCAALAAAGLSCQPTMFEGQRLALR